MNYNKLTKKNSYIFVDGVDINEKLLIYYGLVSSLCNENQGEVRYIKELVSKKIDCNFPLLVCDCDCDFHCTVVVVKVKFFEDCVKWEKIGVVSGTDRLDKKTFWKNYNDSGIRRVEDWSDDDWEKYGDIAFDLIKDDCFFYDWCGKNWQEELYRRCWGYYHKYFNDYKNIDWVSELDLKFEINEYQKFFLEKSV